MRCKRYLPPEQLEHFFAGFDTHTKTTLGVSVENRPIQMIKIGTGPYKVLMWSQMHGNESTTTKALLDFVPWFLDENQKKFQLSFTLYIIPQLNPDGSHLYTRHNANNIDLNRDAIDQSQPESRVLRAIYEKTQPDLCLNLHGQRTIYAAGKSGHSASLSFLSPSADVERTVTPARKKAMGLISALAKALEKELPNAIGRYDDTFNANCVGDSFTLAGTPTILFEAGHVPNDYQREQTRVHVFNAYKALFTSLIEHQYFFELWDYLKIPQNEVEFCDLILSGVSILDEGNKFVNQKIAIQYRETLTDGEIEFLPEMIAYGAELQLRAHKYIRISESLKTVDLEFKSEKLVKNTAFIDLLSLKS